MKYDELSFKNFLEGQHKVYSPNTIESYLYDAKSFLEYMQGKKWTKDSIDTFLMNAFSKPATFNRHLSSLSKLAIFLKKPNYFKNYKRAETEFDQVVLSKEEIKSFFKTFNLTVCYAYRDYLMALMLFLHPELNVSDLIGAQRSLTRRKMMYVTNFLPIALTKKEYKIFKPYLTTFHDEIFQGTMFMFPSKKKGAMTRKSVWRIIEKHGQQVNLDVSPRILRSTALTLSVEEREELI